MSGELRVFGAAEHNLRDVDVTFGPGLTAVVGVSGSGKSSLAFDVVYAEARRRFMESLALGRAGARVPAAKVRRIEELLAANGRKRSDLEIAACPYMNRIGSDDLARYRDAGLDELAVLALDTPSTERDIVEHLERMAREFVEPAAKL
jgi:hypothetical protein